MLALHLLTHIMTGAPPGEPILVEDRYGNDVYLVPKAPKVHPASERSGSRAPAKPQVPDTPPSRCPDNMVYVPGGTFYKKRIPGFCLDRYEVTIGALDVYLQSLHTSPGVTKKSVDALRSRLRSIDWPEPDQTQSPDRSARCTWNQKSDNPRLPANCISHDEAAAYCIAQGKRLPSEPEWQWAARGGRKAAPYPWGTGRPRPERLNMAHAGQDPQLVQVGSYPSSPGGLHDLSGNVSEWTASEPAATTCEARGGSYRSLDEKAVKVTAVMSAPSRQVRSDEIGFRCAAPARTQERAR